jgi:hypothetical protein
VLSQKSLVTKVVGLGKMHNPAKNRVKIQKFVMELAQTMVNLVEHQVKACLVAFFVKRFSLEPWYDMFGIFPRYHITYHDSMRWFSIFLIFLNLLCSHFKSRSNSRCPSCMLGGWGTQVCDRFWGCTPSSHLQVFFPKFFDVWFM